MYLRALYAYTEFHKVNVKAKSLLLYEGKSLLRYKTVNSVSSMQSNYFLKADQNAYRVIYPLATSVISLFTWLVHISSEIKEL